MLNLQEKPSCSIANIAARLVMAARTDPGMVRKHNEDAVFVNPQRGLAILADGMGGYSAGEVASAMATTLLARALEQGFSLYCAPLDNPQSDEGYHPRTLIHEQILRANAAIHYAAQRRPQCSGMGTTVVLALFHGNHVTVAHLGDSRCYRLRGGVLEQLTRDHSLVQEQIDAGLTSALDARCSPIRNLVTRALGAERVVEPEIHEYEVHTRDCYLLCSDGLNDMLDNHDIAQALLSPDAAAPEQAADHLIRLANERGGRDNVSVILVKVENELPEALAAFADPHLSTVAGKSATDESH